MEGGEQEYWITNRVFLASSFGQHSEPVVLILPVVEIAPVVCSSPVAPISPVVCSSPVVPAGSLFLAPPLFTHCVWQCEHLLPVNNALPIPRRHQLPSLQHLLIGSVLLAVKILHA